MGALFSQLFVAAAMGKDINTVKTTYGRWMDTAGNATLISKNGIVSAYKARRECMKSEGFKHANQTYSGKELHSTLSKLVVEYPKFAENFAQEGQTIDAEWFLENVEQVKKILPYVRKNQKYPGLISICGDGSLSFVQLNKHVAMFVADGGGYSLYSFLQKK
ncbi:MAG: hypothetical protein ACRCV6_09810 [Formosimonas sp.]